jgi:hypothetical protein
MATGGYSYTSVKVPPPPPPVQRSVTTVKVIKSDDPARAAELRVAQTGAKAAREQVFETLYSQEKWVETQGLGTEYQAYKARKDSNAVPGDRAYAWTTRAHEKTSNKRKNTTGANENNGGWGIGWADSATVKEEPAAVKTDITNLDTDSDDDNDSVMIRALELSKQDTKRARN